MFAKVISLAPDVVPLTAEMSGGVYDAETYVEQAAVNGFNEAQAKKWKIGKTCQQHLPLFFMS